MSESYAAKPIKCKLRDISDSTGKVSITFMKRRVVKQLDVGTAISTYTLS